MSKSVLVFMPDTGILINSRRAAGVWDDEQIANVTLFSGDDKDTA